MAGRTCHQYTTTTTPPPPPHHHHPTTPPPHHHHHHHHYTTTTSTTTNATTTLPPLTQPHSKSRHLPLSSTFSILLGLSFLLPPPHCIYLYASLPSLFLSIYPTYRLQSLQFVSLLDVYSSPYFLDSLSITAHISSFLPSFPPSPSLLPLFSYPPFLAFIHVLFPAPTTISIYTYYFPALITLPLPLLFYA